METFHPPKETQESNNDNVLQDTEGISEKWLLEKIDNLIPLIQEKWPNIAAKTIEATKGSIDDLVNVIEENTGHSALGIKKQLLKLLTAFHQIIGNSQSIYNLLKAN